MSVKRIKNFLVANWPLVLILVAVGFLMTFRLGRDLFTDWDEGLYAVYARTMQETGYWLNNVWNGYQDLQKPPLYTWLLQIPYLFSFNEFSARLINVVGSLTLVSLVYLFTKKYFSQTVALLASFILLTIEVFVIFSMRLNTDIWFTVFVFAAFWSWIESFKKSNYSYLAGLFFALAVMIKGLSIVQYLAPLFLAILFNPKKEKFVVFFKMILTTTVLIAPWHILAYLKHGKDFIQIYLYENLIQRSRNPIEFHYGGRLYYVKQFVREYGLWLLTLLTLPIYYLLDFKKFLSFKNVRKELVKNEIIFTIFLLIAIPFLALTLAQTKLPWYALPISPFIAMFMAYSIVFVLEKLKLERLAFVFILLAILDAGNLFYQEIKPYKVHREVSARDEVALKSATYPQKELHYLVPLTERTAKALLDQSPNLQIRSTFVYGGNPNAVYYSKKKVYYYYSTEEFLKAAQTKDGLFLLENKDRATIEDDLFEVLFQNPDYTLFGKN